MGTIVGEEVGEAVEVVVAVGLAAFVDVGDGGAAEAVEVRFAVDGAIGAVASLAPVVGVAVGPVGAARVTSGEIRLRTIEKIAARTQNCASRLGRRRGVGLRPRLLPWFVDASSFPMFDRRSSMFCFSPTAHSSRIGISYPKVLTENKRGYLERN